MISVGSSAGEKMNRLLNFIKEVFSPFTKPETFDTKPEVILEEMSKAELLEYAAEVGIDAKKSWKKAKIIDFIKSV
jgi:hypothetical protein